MLNEPDPSYHGAVWTEAVKPLGPIAYILKARVTLQRDLGYALSPSNAFLFLQGLETLPLRIREHCRNAVAVAEFLKGHRDVVKVIFPSLQDGESRRRADTYLKGGFGGLVRSEEHTSELQSLMRSSYAVFCLKTKTKNKHLH